jgi:ABC-type phosphate transport system ATPase subunit
MKITIPKLSLVVLIGPSGSGKSTFARKHFRPTEVLSADAAYAVTLAQGSPPLPGPAAGRSRRRSCPG